MCHVVGPVGKVFFCFFIGDAAACVIMAVLLEE